MLQVEMVDRDLLRPPQEWIGFRSPRHRKVGTDAGAFAMLLAGRIDSRILQDAKRLNMTRKELVSFMKFIKLTDMGKSVTIHNRKKRHAEVAKELGLSFDTSVSCLG